MLVLVLVLVLVLGFGLGSGHLGAGVSRQVQVEEAGGRGGQPRVRVALLAAEVRDDEALAEPTPPLRHARAPPHELQEEAALLVDLGLGVNGRG